ncbi:cytochrome c biogenesis protein ResB [Helcobacillus massiliensis]|uniref:cytochrome c biogenesis protein ResB n=1 Tax=Helcobacillus massiliensis TaxID=521392 RepID=UPI002556E6F4|nr:cytochrome c biogenesis protein ResB [Helcobacillus massiliensis]MDK7743014.1 cytochrome c biogenesis protein ResB [Helcobacillus massiliensis]WOO92322.1 cytochrome c biogenesis protein ResB [Helcobacillus massiliensis]
MSTAAPEPAAPDSAAPESAASGPKKRPTLPSLGLMGWLRFLWRQLTSMQTALILLMLLAIAAVPGSLYPQRSVNPGLTEQYLQEHGKTAEILDKLGMFDVFGSVWFSAIYLLLFVSLIGCVIPRLQVYLRQVVAKPPVTPRRLTRFTGYTDVTLDPSALPAATSADAPSADGSPTSAADLRDRFAQRLRRSRYRIRTTEDERGFAVSSERGYLREAGNLLFHVALLGVLIGVAMGHLTSYRGQVTVVEGEGFANSLTRYDSFEAGPWFDETSLPPFRFTLDEFRAEFNTDTDNPREFGKPTKFEADVTASDPDQPEFTKTVRVNQPLNLGGSGIYLLGNGYAPVLTVTDPKGRVIADGPVITVPQGLHYTSQLVLKMPDARPKQMAVVGIFAPTMVIDDKGPHSEYAGLVNPEIALTVHTGDLGLDGGVPQNVFQIDVQKLDPVTKADGSPMLIRLGPGETTKLPDGTTIEFTDVKRFAAFDVKRDPWEGFTLAMALASIVGLVASLFIPRRRIFVRVAETSEGLRLEAAGLARSEDYRLQQDVQELVAEVTGRKEADE